MLLRKADVLNKNGYNHNFPLVSLCRKFLTLLHSTYQVNHWPKMFGFSLFEKFPYMERRQYTKKNEPKIPIFFREHKVSTFGADTSQCLI